MINSIPPAVIIFFLGMLPISEIRGAIPLGILHYDMPLSQVLILALAGNIFITAILLMLLRAFLRLLSFWGWGGKLTSFLFQRTRKQHQTKFLRWGDIALVLIVAIPLPFTGAWTGVLASLVFGISPKKAFPLITLGILIAALIVTLLTLNGVYLFSLKKL